MKTRPSRMENNNTIQLREIALLVSLCMLLLALAGCAVELDADLPTKTRKEDGASVRAEGQTTKSADCPVTTPITITPPDSKYRDPLPRGAYYASADEMILVSAEEWGQGSRKILWIKPLGSRLTVQGRRLDGDAAPLWPDISSGYYGDFEASIIIIPAAGCWEIEARANASVLRFVLFIPPRQQPDTAPSCAGIDDVVRLVNVIVVGNIERRVLDSSGRWAWQSVRVMRSLYPYSFYREYASPGTVLMVLQDGAREPLLAAGDDYVLVLRGNPWQVVCPQRTLAAVDSAKEPARVEILTPGTTFWSGETVPEIEAQIRAAHLQ